jgi:YfiH family protein
MSALESALLRSLGFRHGFSVRPWDFKNDREASEDAIGLILRLPTNRIFQVSQVHGARAVMARPHIFGERTEEADAIVATTPETAVGVRVADCVPILLADSKTGAVAAVHAGWRGVVAGVIASAMKLHAFDLAAIGPCIGTCCFEIGDDVIEKLRPHVKDRHGDLRGAVRAQLVSAGLQNAHIDDVAGCTKCDEARFFSYRRDGESSGRHLAVISTRA